MEKNSGLPDFLNIHEDMAHSRIVMYNEDDIIRGGAMKEYIIQRQRYFEKKKPR